MTDPVARHHAGPRAGIIAAVTASWLFALWDGGGNVGPFLCLAEQLLDRGDRVTAVATGSLAERLGALGVDHIGVTDAWLPEAEHLLAAVGEASPDALVVDYMLTSALCGAERTGLPVVALVHTLYRELLVDGAPHPMQMAGPVGAVNDARAAIGLAPVATHGDLLDRTDLVLVAAPQELDAAGDVPANVAYVGALAEGPGPDRAWSPPPGPEPLVVASTGTAGDPASQTDLLARVLVALGTLDVRGFATVPHYIDRARLRPPPNVVLSGHVRHAAVLPHADALITHAGLGSVLAGLAHGLPLVCLPLGRDQPDNARAVARAEAGVALPPDAPPEDIARAVAAQLARGGSVSLTPDPARAVDALVGVLAPR